MSEAPLAQEMAIYRRNRKDWADRSGEYVLIKGDDVSGFYSSYDDALKAGYEKFGLAPFFVKQVSVVEQAHHVTRMLEPCHTSHSQVAAAAGVADRR